MWSQRPAPAYFSKGPGVAFAIRASTAIFGPTEFGVRFWSPLLGAGTSLLLYYFARRLFSATGGFWLVVALNVTPIFNLGGLVMTIDPLSIFFWVAAMLHFLAGPRAQSRIFPGGGRYGSAHRSRFLLQIHQRAGADLNRARARARPSVAPRIPAARFLSAACQSSLLCTLPPIIWNAATRLDHAGASPIARESRRSAGLSSARIARFSRRAFRDLFAVAFSRAGLGGDRELAPRAPEIQSALYLLWFGLPVFVFYLLLSMQQSGRAELGWARFPQPRRARGLPTGGNDLATAGNHSVSSPPRFCSGFVHERGRARY